MRGKWGNDGRTARRRRGAALAGLVLAGLLAPGAWAGTAPAERRVRPMRMVEPRATSSPTGLTPAQVKAAYDFPTSSSAGVGETIAIVVAYDHPRIESDLKAFSKAFGLPPCTRSNGCFKKVNHKGGTSYPAANKGWAMETALDVQWAHAIAPGAKILLVEAKSDRLSDVLKAHDYATRKAKYVSNSWGLSEYSGQSSKNHHFDRPGVSIFAASGDDGAGPGPGYPSTAPGVIAVGGTTLVDVGKPSFLEKGWRGSGGGCSRYEDAPAAQSAFTGYDPMGCNGRRATPDVSLVSDPASGVSVYNTYKTSQPWTRVGGTSAATPMWAARAAISGRVVDA
ncbi:MAG TPA: S53 family peptidase, partial [Acidimicrobiia bacterium]|nr:S53 family peptidase [Acidimicrobiia bacterium]